MLAHPVKDNIRSDFFISHNISTQWLMREYHFHDVFEIYYALSEGLKYFVNDKVYEVNPGDLFIFNNMDLHKTVVPSNVPYDRFILVFHPDYIRDLSSDVTDLLEFFMCRPLDFSHKIHLEQEKQQQLLSLFDKAIGYQQTSEYGADIYRKIILAEVLLLINQQYRANTPFVDKKPGENYKKVLPVLNFIRLHLAEDLSLDRLSGLFYMNKSYLNCVFKQATGFTIHEYIISRRIQKAQELLTRGLSVSDVGERVGYMNEPHFIRTFKKYIGVPPGKYSRQIK